MKSPEEIKEGIKKCLSGVSCNRNCPYSCETTPDKICTEVLRDDINEYVYSLEERIAIMTDRPIAHWVDEYQEFVPFMKDRKVHVFGGAYCSECGELLYGSDEVAVSGAFCPSCGAEMIDKE
ncbi:MAG: hypothetical protein J6X83_04345 [Methanomicrobium sp.]|nr:hypothetical protein [Methanomicrobium sp.]